jgi:hypothetical protein
VWRNFAFEGDENDALYGEVSGWGGEEQLAFAKRLKGDLRRRQERSAHSGGGTSAGSFVWSGKRGVKAEAGKRAERKKRGVEGRDKVVKCWRQ